MIKFNQKQQKILEVILKNGKISSSAVHKEIKEYSLVTIKRSLAELVKLEALKVFGAGRSTVYELSIFGRFFLDIDADEYCSIEPDFRYGLKSYNFNIFSESFFSFFSDEELSNLSALTDEYKERSKNLSQAIKKKELERFIIELSWKSSKLEGNTYTLLDTEKLILENKEAKGKTKFETQMIINHKNAFQFILENIKDFKILNISNLKELHEILVEKLNIPFDFRKHAVGITGSIYRPLSNFYQIEDALKALIESINKIDDCYSKALLLLLGISYIQPFEDGNKRTSRMLADAVLIGNDFCPLSYRSISEKEYRNAILTFYELNSVIPFKKIFIDQYIFTSKNYLKGY